jgi:hypothetical protein
MRKYISCLVLTVRNGIARFLRISNPLHHFSTTFTVHAAAMPSSALLYQTLILMSILHATALPHSPNTNDTSAAKNAWSKEAILGLVAVLVAITLFAIGLTTNILRKCITYLSKCMLSHLVTTQT